MIPPHFAQLKDDQQTLAMLIKGFENLEITLQTFQGHPFFDLSTGDTQQELNKLLLLNTAGWFRVHLEETFNPIDTTVMPGRGNNVHQDQKPITDQLLTFQAIK